MRAREALFAGALFSQGERVGPPRRACFELAAGRPRVWAYAHPDRHRLGRDAPRAVAARLAAGAVAAVRARAEGPGPLELFRTDTGSAAARPRRRARADGVGPVCSVLWGRVEGVSRSRPTQVLLGKAAHAIRHGAGALGRVVPQTTGKKGARAARAEPRRLRRRGRRAVAAQYRRAPPRRAGRTTATRRAASMPGM